MGSSSHKRRKSSSSKAHHRLRDKTKKGSHNVSLSDSEDFSSSSDSEDEYRDRKKISKRTKKLPRNSPSHEEKRSHKRIRSRRRSRSIDRRKGIKKKRRTSLSSCSCSARSNWSSSSSVESDYEKPRKSHTKAHQEVKRRKRSRYQSPLSRSCSSRSRSCNSSMEMPRKRISSVITVPKELEDRELVEYVEDGNKAEILQSNDDYPSSRSNESNEEGTKKSLDVAIISCKSAETSKCELSVVESSADGDLESRLRQKALENLAKFRFRCLAKEQFVADQEGESPVSKSIRTDFHESNDKMSDSLRERHSSCNDTKRSPESSCQHSLLAKVGDHAAIVRGSDLKIPEQTPFAKTEPQTPKSAPGATCVGSLGVEIVDRSAPGASSEARNQSTVEGKGEAKCGSELEEKTMSVMRGGELVQVKYKVHVPKNSPALARRKLQR